MPLKDGSPVCHFCRTHFFNPAGFSAALAARQARDHSWEHSFSYITQPWKDLESSANDGCNWCYQIWKGYFDAWKLSKPQFALADDKCLGMEVWFAKPDPPHGVTLIGLIEKNAGMTWAVYGSPGRWERGFP